MLWGQEVRFPWFWLQGSEECFLQFSSVQSLSSVTLCDPTDRSTPGLCPSPTPRVYSNSCPLSWWCHPTISSSIVPFSSSLQSFPASGSFQMSQLFTSDGQSIGVSDSTSVLPMNILDWFPLGWIGWVSWLSKGLSRVFSNTIVQKYQFFHAQVLPWRRPIYLLRMLCSKWLIYLSLDFVGNESLPPNFQNFTTFHFLGRLEWLLILTIRTQNILILKQVLVSQTYTLQLKKGTQTWQI